MVGLRRILADNAKQRNVVICLFLKGFYIKNGLMRSQNLAPPKGQVGDSNPLRYKVLPMSQEGHKRIFLKRHCQNLS